jgi:probable HAF family extracellular repeat protein
LHKKFTIVSFITGTAGLLFCSIGCHTVFAAEYSVTELTNSNASIFHPNFINNRSEIAGVSFPFNAGMPFASVYSNGTIRALGSLDDRYSEAVSINDSGQATGCFSLTNFFLPSVVHAFVSTPAGLQDFGTLGGSNSIGVAINQGGDIAGYSETSNVVKHAFLYSGGTMTDLGTLGGSNSYACGINNLGQIVGQSDTTNGETHGFLSSGGHMADLGTLGGSFSSPAAINDFGQIVGRSSTTAGMTNAFLYTGNKMLDLGNLFGGGLLAINNSGQAVGTSFAEGDDYLPLRGVIYRENLLQDANNLIDPTTGWFLGMAKGINDRGQIVGIGSHNSVGWGFLMSMVK